MPDDSYYKVQVAKCFPPEFRRVDGTLITVAWPETADAQGFSNPVLTEHHDDNPIAEYNRFIDFVMDVAPEIADAFVFLGNAGAL